MSVSSHARPTLPPPLVVSSVASLRTVSICVLNFPPTPLTCDCPDHMILLIYRPAASDPHGVFGHRLRLWALNQHRPACFRSPLGSLRSVQRPVASLRRLAVPFLDTRFFPETLFVAVRVQSQALPLVAHGHCSHSLCVACHVASASGLNCRPQGHPLLGWPCAPAATLALYSKCVKWRIDRLHRT